MQVLVNYERRYPLQLQICALSCHKLLNLKLAALFNVNKSL